MDTDKTINKLKQEFLQLIERQKEQYHPALFTFCIIAFTSTLIFDELEASAAEELIKMAIEQGKKWSEENER